MPSQGQLVAVVTRGKARKKRRGQGADYLAAVSSVPEGEREVSQERVPQAAASSSGTQGLEGERTAGVKPVEKRQKVEGTEGQAVLGAVSEAQRRNSGSDGSKALRQARSSRKPAAPPTAM